MSDAHTCCLCGSTEHLPWVISIFQKENDAYIRGSLLTERIRRNMNNPMRHRQEREQALTIMHLWRMSEISHRDSDDEAVVVNMEWRHLNRPFLVEGVVTRLQEDLIYMALDGSPTLPHSRAALTLGATNQILPSMPRKIMPLSPGLLVISYRTDGTCVTEERRVTQLAVQVVSLADEYDTDEFPSSDDDYPNPDVETFARAGDERALVEVSPTHQEACSICLQVIRTLSPGPSEPPMQNILTSTSEPSSDPSAQNTDAEPNTWAGLNCCGHIFHRECIKGWLRIGRTCPMCRAEIVAA